MESGISRFETIKRLFKKYGAIGIAFFAVKGLLTLLIPVLIVRSC